MCRARRVQLGSHRLKLWYLSLCTLGRAGTGVDDVLEIGIKQDSLAGEFETTRKRVVLVLAELRETGLVHVIRSQHHTKIRIFLTPHRPLAVSVDPERGSSGPAAGGSVDPERGSSGLNVSGSPSAVRTCDVRTTYKQQQQQQHAVSVHPPTAKQLRGIESMALELAVSVPPVHDRLAADVLFRPPAEAGRRPAAQPSARAPAASDCGGSDGRRPVRRVRRASSRSQGHLSGGAVSLDRLWTRGAPRAIGIEAAAWGPDDPERGSTGPTAGGSDDPERGCQGTFGWSGRRPKNRRPGESSPTPVRVPGVSRRRDADRS